MSIRSLTSPLIGSVAGGLIAGGVPATPFSPTDISGLQGWWNPKDTGTLWEDTSATTAATTDVARMDDNSDNDYYFTSTSEPVTGGTINSTNALTFNGTKNMVQGDIKSSGWTGLTLSMVYQPSSLSGIDYLMDQSPGSNGFLFRTDGNKIEGGAFDATNGLVFVESAVQALVTGTPALLTLRVGSHGVEIWRNGILYALDTSDSLSSIVSVGSGSLILGAESGGNRAVGDIGEVILYDHSITDSELASLHTYLNGRSGTGSTFTDKKAFLLIGQSNMVGRDSNDSGANYPEGTLQYDQDGTIRAAISPLDHHDAGAGTMGLAKQYAIDYQAANTNTQIVFLPYAKGETGFAAGDWEKGDFYYEAAVDAANDYFAANPSVTLEQILVQLGETDAQDGNTNFAADMDQFIADLRSDITAADSTTPLTWGGMVPSWASVDVNARLSVQADIEDVGNRNPYTAYVSSAGLTDRGDDIHFDNTSVRTLGSRHYTALATAKANTP